MQVGERTKTGGLDRRGRGDGVDRRNEGTNKIVEHLSVSMEI